MAKSNEAAGSLIVKTRQWIQLSDVDLEDRRFAIREDFDPVRIMRYEEEIWRHEGLGSSRRLRCGCVMMSDT